MTGDGNKMIDFDNIMKLVKEFNIYYKGVELEKCMHRYRLKLANRWHFDTYSREVLPPSIAVAAHWQITVTELESLSIAEQEILHAQYIINHLIRILSEYESRESRNWNGPRNMKGVAFHGFVRHQ